MDTLTQEQMTLKALTFINKAKTLAHKAAVSATTSTLGNAHFIAKSTADTIVLAEASIIKKLTGKSIEHTTEDRHNATEDAQDMAKAFGNKILGSIKGINKTNHTTTIYHIASVIPTQE